MRKVVNVPSSFVKKAIKIATDKGSGESKLFIGPTSSEKDFDAFFDNFIKDPKCYMLKSELLDYMKFVKIEYYTQAFCKYQKVSKSYYDDRLTELSSLKTDRVEFNICKFLSQKRYYIRPISQSQETFDTYIRAIALPKITDIVIEKINGEFKFSLDLNWQEILQRALGISNEYGDASNEKEIVKIDEPCQKIYHGAPGTGKSYNLNQKANELFPYTTTRVTFHPNYLYANFVGTYKPFPSRDSNRENTITYKFVPGPLLNCLTEAILHPEMGFLLIIEEINRADVAAVFGDIFQLLDRKNNESQYPIAMSEDIKDYFAQLLEENKLTTEEAENLKKYLAYYKNSLVLPANLFIWATMNSADQGVKPMDAAFKRRWELEYVGINEGVTADFKNYNFKLVPNDYGQSLLVNWDEFRRKINDVLVSKYKVPEDKLLGPYFISAEVLDSGVDKLTEAVKNKVLMYLFDDAVKPYRNNFFSEKCAKTYSALCEQFSIDGRKIFKENISFKVFYDGNDSDDTNIANEDGIAAENPSDY